MLNDKWPTERTYLAVSQLGRHFPSGKIPGTILKLTQEKRWKYHRKKEQLEHNDAAHNQPPRQVMICEGTQDRIAPNNRVLDLSISVEM